MSLFGSLMGDFDDEMGFMGNPMNAINAHMRSMNRLINSFNPDPFNMLGGFDTGLQSNALMERGNGMGGGLFGFPAMPNINRLLNADIGAGNGQSYCSSSVITMSSGPDGRPQIYQASQSTKTGPGGIRETRKTIQDSVSGVKKMAIGHHIGERAHIIEKEQDLRSGQLEERQEFINLEEEEANNFDREFVNRAHRSLGGRHGATPAIRAAPTGRDVLTIEEIDDDDDEDNYQKSKHRRTLPALPAPQHHTHNSSSETSAAKGKKSSTNSSNVTTSATKNSVNTSILSDTSSSSAKANPTNQHSNTNSGTQLNTSSPGHRRAYRNHLTGGISSRRPIRTPSSSPLATTPTVPTHSTITTSPSVHPHPYNTSGRRSHHRSSKNHHGPKQRAEPDMDGVVTVKPIKTDKKSNQHQKNTTDEE